jgi:hypothetical protein
MTEEVPHEGLFRLLQSTGNEWKLVHLATGERVSLGTSAVAPELHLFEGRAFVRMGDERFWASSRMSSSLWEEKTTKRRFVFTKYEDGYALGWLSEFHVQREALRVEFKSSWRGNERCFDIIVNHFFCGRPNTGFRLFWDMDSVQQALNLKGLSQAFATRWVRHGFSGSWAQLLLRCGASEQHMIATASSKGCQADIYASQWLCTTVALLVLAIHW